MIVHPFGGDRALYSHKVMLPFAGTLEIGAEQVGLAEDRGFAIIDDHHGDYPRPMRYDWLTAVRRADDGRVEGFNLTRNQTLDPDTNNENALWLGDRLIPLGRARFTWNPNAILDGWQVRTTDGVLDLSFKPWAAHQELRDLKVVKSAFKQPVGLWQGEVKVDGRSYTFKDAPGVAEDQSVRW